LADALRDDGHGVSNARASLLLKLLRAETNGTSIDATSTRHAGSFDSPTSA
jgi:hypothetical protein